MPKSTGTAGNTPGGRSGTAIVDVVHRRRSDRLAKLTFTTVTAVLIPAVTVVAAAITSWWLALLIGVAGGVAVATVAAVVVFIWPMLRMVWYWAGEITALLALLGSYWLASWWLPWPVAVGLLTLAVALPLVLPRSRRWLLAWGWCAVSRHRLRTCFATFIRANRYGSLPLILLARPTLAGERVWVWLRPGLSLEDLTTEAGLDRLAVGCWARQVKLVRGSRRYAALLRVDITRRHPLSATIGSPLPGLLDADVDWLTDMADVDGLPADDGSLAGLDLADVPSAGVEPVSAGRSGGPGSHSVPKPRRSNGNGHGRSAPVVDGDDLSEWV